MEIVGMAVQWVGGVLGLWGFAVFPTTDEALQFTTNLSHIKLTSGGRIQPGPDIGVRGSFRHRTVDQNKPRAERPNVAQPIKVRDFKSDQQSYGRAHPFSSDFAERIENWELLSNCR